MSKLMTFAEATALAMAEEMRRDPNVFVIGEDIQHGGIFGQFKNLTEEFGKERIIDTPISETAIVGASLGAAITGLVPVVDMHFADFLGVAMDEIFNQVAKVRYMFGGQVKVPMVIRAPDGVVRSVAAQHSQCLEAWFLHVPGLKVVIPANPEDARGLLKSAIRDPNPILFFEHKDLFSNEGSVTVEEDILTPIGKASILQEGQDVTIISYSKMLQKVLEASGQLAAEGIRAEVIDLRTIYPYDKATILESVKKTSRVVIVHEACKIGGVGAELSAFLAEEAIDYLDSPVTRIGAKHVPVPFSPPMEKYVIPQVDEIYSAVKKLF